MSSKTVFRNLNTILSSKLKNKGVKNIKFIVMGDGPLRKEFEQYAKYKKIKAQFTGFLEYRKMVGILSKCELAVLFALLC